MSEVLYDNLDPAEKRRFEDIAASWWDPEGPMKPLHTLNPARLEYVAERCELQDRDVLDVGCGGGIFAESLASRSARVTGIDVAQKVIEIARLHLLESGLEVNYEVTTAEEKAQAADATFDVVTCMEMLEHVPDPVSVIRAVARTLRPGGHAFFSTLNRTALAFLLGIVGAEYVAGICPKGTHRYDRFIRPSELGNWLRTAGLQVVDIRGIHYDPVAGSVMVGGHTRVNYLLHARRPS
ncbi:MAG: bifunctional 2-polyprenyl-6-hydroxyphenol methylase/3-demethylubiquinol 3-O-methyltransferase UbiG [Xanthomonadales bacterium]|nr:bifunctional 2-polyprenyl-6-hydroxyphenol methylase/3-demethylubiquinol 3-O-methyltransferase UbiG [Xanthomonadales bacterium]